MSGGTTAKTLTVDVNVTASELVKTYSAVATGAIDAGDFVELMPDGTVRVAQYVSPVSAGTATDFAAYNTNHGYDSCYDSLNQRIVVIYRRLSDSYPMAVVGTVSGDSILFGTPVEINAGASGGTSLLTCCFDNYNNKVVVFYATSGGQPVARVGTVSDTTISFGDVSYPQPGNNGSNYATCCFDTINNKVAYFVNDAGTVGRCWVGTVSGTTISFGAISTFESGQALYSACCYDPVNNRIFVTYSDVNGSYYGTCWYGYISGTTIVTTSTNIFEKTNTGSLTCCFDSSNNKLVIIYVAESNAIQKSIVGTYVNGALHFGFVENLSKVFYSSERYKCCFDPITNRIFICFTNCRAPW